MKNLETDQDIMVVFSGKLGIVQIIWFCSVSESFIMFELFYIAVGYIILILMQIFLPIEMQIVSCWDSLDYCPMDMEQF